MDVGLGVFFLEVQQVRHERPLNYANDGAAGPDLARLEQLLQARRGRETFFGPNLFSDPAWDILLNAYVALLSHEVWSVAELCAATPAPATTAVRWINKLEQDGWLVRHDHPSDAELALIELTPMGKSTMERYMASVWPSALPL